MKIFGSAHYYRLMLLLYAAMALYIIVTLWKVGWEARYFLGSTVILSLYILYLAFYFSWNSAFQPQGRYLFPVLGLFAFLFGRYGKALGKQVAFYALLLAVAALSAYSFIAYGLINIPKA